MLVGGILHTISNSTGRQAIAYRKDSHAVEEFLDGDAEGVGESRDVLQCRIPETGFDAAEVRAMDAGSSRQRFLREAAIISQVAYTRPKAYRNEVESPRHGPIVAPLLTISLQTISNHNHRTGSCEKFAKAWADGYGIRALALDRFKRMGFVMKTIELIGNIDGRHALHADVPHDVPPGAVRITLLLPEDDEGDAGWMQAITTAWAADCDNAADDLYTIEDGKPVDWE